MRTARRSPALCQHPLLRGADSMHHRPSRRTRARTALASGSPPSHHPTHPQSETHRAAEGG
eukprot:49326-Eustigmatos_ZCMA.PRE.1